MKKIIWILALLVMALISCVVLFKCNNPFKKEVQKLKIEHNINQDTKQIKVIQHQLNDEDSTNHYLVKQVIHSETDVISGTKPQLNIFLKNKFDSVCSILKIKDAQISQLEGEKLSAKGEIYSGISVIGNNKYEVPFSDCFLSGTGYIDLNIMAQELDYKANIKIHGVEYIHRRHNFLFLHFGKVTYKRNMWTDCPNVEIDSIQDIKIISN